MSKVDQIAIDPSSDNVASLVDPEPPFTHGLRVKCLLISLPPSMNRYGDFVHVFHNNLTRKEDPTHVGENYQYAVGDGTNFGAPHMPLKSSDR